MQAPKTVLSRKLRFLALLMSMAAIVVTCVVVFGYIPESAGWEEDPAALASAAREQAAAEELVEQQREAAERHARFEAAAKRRAAERARLVAEREAQVAAGPSAAFERLWQKQLRARRLFSFAWESPPETRGKAWNVPEGDTSPEEATLTAFVRICIAEADGYLQDCVGIWQVMKNIRRRSCERGHVRRITQCEEGGGETLLSVMRRAQPHILAMPGYKLRNDRAAWIRNVTTDCENPPEGWGGTENQWDARYGSKRCPHVVELGQYLMKGKLPPDRPGVDLEWLPGRPITWGGRCETKRASCDDQIACQRGLARVTGGPDTKNAFWCKIGQRGCRTTPEPVCVALGYGSGEDATDDATEAASAAMEPQLEPEAVPEPEPEPESDPAAQPAETTTVSQTEEAAPAATEDTDV